MRPYTVAVAAIVVGSGALFAQPGPPIPPPAPNGPVFQPYRPLTGADVATPDLIRQSLQANRALFFYASFADSYHQRYMAPFLTMISQRPGYADEYYRRYFKQYEPRLAGTESPPELQLIAADGPFATSAAQAQVTLEVPAHAQVWVEGKKQEFRGTAVRIVSPDLTPDTKYTYAVVVQWTDGKNVAEQKFDLPVAAGDRKVMTVVGKSR
jgi:uncharacterized protein (TIGR03000 family)